MNLLEQSLDALGETKDQAATLAKMKLKGPRCIR